LGNLTTIGSVVGLAFGPSVIAVLAISPFIPSIEAEFGWSRVEVSFAVTIVSYMIVLVSPLQGLLVDRFGPRRVALTSIPLFALGLAAYTTLVETISPMGLAYLHVLRSAPLPNVHELLRPLFNGPFAAGGGFTKESGDAAIMSGMADFVVFGKLFISNPDLPARFAKNAELVSPDPTTFYSVGAKGYTDFASL
jgi:MFS family permease